MNAQSSNDCEPRGSAGANPVLSSKYELFERLFTPAERAGIKGRNCGELYEIEHVVLNILKTQIKTNHQRYRFLCTLRAYIAQREGKCTNF